MKKEVFLMRKRISIVFVFITSFVYQSGFSQCTNPIPTGDPAQLFCKADNSTVADLIVSGGTIAWYDALTGGNIIPQNMPLDNGLIYYAEDIDGGNCSPRFEVSISVYGYLPQNVPVFVGKCAVEEPIVAGLSANGTNIEWFDAQTGGNLISPSDLLIDGMTYWVQQTENGCVSDRLPTTVSLIDPPPPMVETTQYFCIADNPTVSDLTATESAVLWYDSETATIPLDTNTLLIDGFEYWSTQVSFPCESTSRSKVLVEIDNEPNAGSNGSSDVCETDAVTTNLFELLDGSPEMNGTWSGPSVLTNDYLGTFEPGVNISGDYTYTVTSEFGACPNATATVSINVITIPPPSTTNPTQEFCETQGATVGDLIASGDNIQWYDSETGGNLLADTDLLSDGVYWASQTDTTSGCESVQRLLVNVVIITITPPTTTNANQSFCETQGATVADLVATGNNIQWFDAATGGNVLADTAILSDGQYWASQTDATSGCESLTRLLVNVSIISVLPPTTTNSSQTYCEIENTTIADLDVTGNNVQWYDAATGGNVLSTTDLVANGQYYASQTDASTGCESVSRLLVDVVVTSITPPTVAETDQEFCEIDNATIANLSVTGTNILWYDAETNGNLLADTTALANGTYWASQTETSSGCESATRTLVNVTILVTTPPTTSSSVQSFCEQDNATINDLNISGNSITWYNSESSTTPLDPTDAIIDGNVYWATQTDATSVCESSTRLSITASIVVPLAPTSTNTSQSFCISNNPTISDLQVDGTGILWYDTETSTTPLNSTDSLADGEDYWATQSDPTLGCESIPRLMIDVILLDVAAPIITIVNQSFCASDFPSLQDLQVSGNGINWFASETDTTPLDANTLLQDNTSYWSAQSDTNSDCISSVRTVVNVSLSDPGTPSIILLGNEFCSIDQPTLFELNDRVTSANGGTITWYDGFPNGAVLNLTQPLAEGETYFAVESDNAGCTSVTPLQVLVTLGACDQYDIHLYDGFSPTGNGINDTFKIGNLRVLYPDFSVEFYNRWGNLIYTANSANPDWNGRLNGDGELVPAGVYYFVIYFNKNNRKPLQKRLYLSR